MLITITKMPTIGSFFASVQIQAARPDIQYKLFKPYFQFRRPRLGI